VKSGALPWPVDAIIATTTEPATAGSTGSVCLFVVTSHLVSFV
jgi:hypothetical protein